MSAVALDLLVGGDCTKDDFRKLSAVEGSVCNPACDVLD